jgi:hypothetical protein
MTSSPIRLKLAACFCVLAVLGCNTDSQPDSPALSARFEISEADIARVEWQVSGGGLVDPIAGLAEVIVGPPLSVAVTIMDLPVATGYGIVIIAYDAANTNICRGSASFDIVEGVTTSLPIVATCSISSTLPSGTVGIDLTFQDNICPVINQINVVPQTIAVGQTAQVSINANDPEGATLTYDWTSLAGTFANPAAATTTYTCTQALDHNVSALVSDGDAFCNQSRLLNVTCVPDVCVGPPVVSCDDGNQCTDDGVCDPVSGCPGSTPSLDGTACNFAAVGDGLCDGAGTCVECLVATDCTDDGNECTEPATCTGNACVAANTASGTACTGGVCDGAGLCVGCLVAGDCSDDGNDCTTGPSCTAGACDAPSPLTAGTICTTGVCNGAGVCVECVDAGDCTDDGNQCTAGPSCTAGACDTPGNLAQGVACDFIALGDGFCDGAGACVECNTALDCPDDGNQCTAAPSCTANACDLQAPLPNTTACDNGGGPASGLCDGAGVCI